MKCFLKVLYMSEDCHLFPAVVGIRFDEEPVKEKWCNPFAWGWRLVSFFGKRLGTFGRRRDSCWLQTTATLV